MNQVPNRAGEISRGFDGNCECFVTCGGLGKSVCSKCKYVNYCSKDCQKSDFKRHKSFCSEHMPLLEYCTRGLTDKVIQAIAAGADVNAQILIPMPKHFPVRAYIELIELWHGIFPLYAMIYLIVMAWLYLYLSMSLVIITPIEWCIRVDSSTDCAFLGHREPSNALGNPSLLPS